MKTKPKARIPASRSWKKPRKRVAELDTMIQNLYESSMKGVLPERQARADDPAVR